MARRRGEQLSAASIPGFLPGTGEEESREEEKPAIDIEATEVRSEPTREVVDDATEYDEPQQGIIRTTIPGTLNDISQASNIQTLLQGRFEAMNVLRRYSIAMTTETDWVLFKAADELTNRETVQGYLQDQGCRRIAGIWNIGIKRVSQPVRTETSDEGRCKTEAHRSLDLHEEQTSCEHWYPVRVFYYTITGDARCGMTGEEIEGLQGMQSSEADFVRTAKMSTIKKDMFVQKAARTNLLGTAVRSLTGLKNLLIAIVDNGVWQVTEIASTPWEGTGRDWKNCPKGRGFGSGGSRKDAVGTLAGETPVCPKCRGPMRFISGEGKSWDSFWGCKKGKEICNGTRKAA